jgi:hypothetical protein
VYLRVWVVRGLSALGNRLREDRVWSHFLLFVECGVDYEYGYGLGSPSSVLAPTHRRRYSCDLDGSGEGMLARWTLEWTSFTRELSRIWLSVWMNPVSMVRPNAFL